MLPIAVITGDKTQFAQPDGVAIDSRGNTYVTNLGNYGGARITEYAPGSNGNVAPIRMVSGSRTLLVGLTGGIALDSKGDIFVTNYDSAGEGRSFVTVYTADSNGDAAPIAMISGPHTGLVDPTGIALDSRGNIYVANWRAGSVTIYPSGANGDAAPIATIRGPNTGLTIPTGIALDSEENIYVTNYGFPPSTFGSVVIYPAGSNGNVGFSGRISGPNTGLTAPWGIAIAR